MLSHCAARTVDSFQSKTKELDHFLTEKILQKKKRMTNNTQSHMQDTTHTNLQIFIYSFIYIPGKPSWWVLCSYWSQMIMWTVWLTTTFLWFPENGGSMGSGGGKKSNITGQVRTYKYVRNKKEKLGNFAC